MTPRVSVVMPNFNKARHISAAIDSVLGQTMGDLELLVIDDASTDESTELVEAKAAGDSRVVLLKQGAHKGPGGCRNVGISESKGAAVAFLDSDDIYAPRALEAKLAALEASPGPAVVYSDYWILGASGEERAHRPERACVSTGMVFEEILVNGISAQANLTMPKSLLDQVGLFDEGLPWGEDTDLILRLAKKFPFRYVNERLYGYRLYEGNTWNRFTSAEQLAMKTEIIERHFRSSEAMLSPGARRSVRRRIVTDFFRARMRKRALESAIPSLTLVGLWASLLLKGQADS